MPQTLCTVSVDPIMENQTDDKMGNAIETGVG